MIQEFETTYATAVRCRHQQLTIICDDELMITTIKHYLACDFYGLEEFYVPEVLIITGIPRHIKTIENYNYTDKFKHIVGHKDLDLALTCVCSEATMNVISDTQATEESIYKEPTHS